MELKDLYALYGELMIELEILQARVIEAKKNIVKALQEKEKPK